MLPKKKILEKLYCIHNNNKNNILRVGGGHSHGNEMCLNTIIVSVGARRLIVLVKGRCGLWPLATGLWLVAPACLCVLQLGDSQVLSVQAGHTKLGEIAASFIDDTTYKQHYYLLRVLFVRVIFSKSWVHGPT